MTQSVGAWWAQQWMWNWRQVFSLIQNLSTADTLAVRTKVPWAPHSLMSVDWVRFLQTNSRYLAIFCSWLQKALQIWLFSLCGQRDIAISHNCSACVYCFPIQFLVHFKHYHFSSKWRFLTSLLESNCWCFVSLFQYTHIYMFYIIIRLY